MQDKRPRGLGQLFGWADNLIRLLKTSSARREIDWLRALGYRQDE
jgi:hypothetical protein